MKRLAVIPLLIGFLLVPAGIWLLGGHLVAFIPPPGVICGLLLVFVLLLASYSPAEMWQAWQAVGLRQEASRQDLQLALAFFSSLRNLLAIVAPLIFLVGTVGMIEGFVKDQMQLLGVCVAVSVNGLLYTFGPLIFIAIPGIQAAKHKLTILSAQAETR